MATLKTTNFRQPPKASSSSLPNPAFPEWGKGKSRGGPRMRQEPREKCHRRRNAPGHVTFLSPNENTKPKSTSFCSKGIKTRNYMSNDIKKNQLGRVEKSFSTIPHSPTKQNTRKRKKTRLTLISFLFFLSFI